MTVYRLLSIFLALLCLAVAAVATRFCPPRPKMPGQLARHRIGGLLLGLLVLCWCAKEGAAMLPARYATPVWLLVPVTAAACWFLLDFLFARALGGFLVLAANHLIQHAFAYYCGERWLYCTIALLWGLAGMTLVTWPWLLRDALEMVAKRPKSRPPIWIFCVLSALAFAILPFCGRS